ncbi:MAG: hypothetical protein LBE70_00420 [Nitrososphaerota archaeon]|jgi:hypothetical protein|nr:hypothetical protein [Nitrososphaerota archaeon]
MVLKFEQMQEKVNAFDKAGLIKHEIEKTFACLKEFRQKFPFVENLREIELLNPDRLFRTNPDCIGEFFQKLEDIFKPLKYTTFGNSNIYRNTHLQINDFKLLLRITVDDRKTLTQKVDAKWERIGGIGQDKAFALKIIYSFNYENKTVLPIFNIEHLRYFINCTSNSLNESTKYFSIGQEYEHFTLELLKNKNSSPIARSWDNLYFTRFLYETYPPPLSSTQTQREAPNEEEKKRVTPITDEQLDMQGFVKLLGELQKQQKITGEEFRENRAIWMQLKPNDRELLVIRLKQRLNNESTTNNSTPKSQPIARRKL